MTLDEPLRVRALETLGPHGDALARTALETGDVSVEHGVLAWEGSHGQVTAHRVIVVVEGELYDAIMDKPATLDGLSQALAAAMAERPGHSVADVRVEPGDPDRAGGSGPYRVGRL
ncbi:MAG: hypothetical protein KF819_31455 [Labilithrix sp.]|nr:hypothetical protein [Labilithrix sp.]